MNVHEGEAPMTTYSPFSTVPTEILSQILHFATTSPLREDFGPNNFEEAWSPPVFSDTAELAIQRQLDDALAIKRAFSSVNRSFNSVMEEYLYEDLRVRHGSDELARILENSSVAGDDDEAKGFKTIGERTRRICLYPADDSSADIWGGTVNKNAYRILRCCPNVEILIRVYENQRKDVPFVSGIKPSKDSISALLDADLYAKPLPLRPLKRLQWLTESSISDSRYTGQALPIPRSLCTNRNIQMLHLRGNCFPVVPSALHRVSTMQLSFPEVHTIRISSLDAAGGVSYGHKRYKLDFPSFNRLILDESTGLYSIFDGYLKTLVSQVQTIDLGCHNSFIKGKFMGTILEKLQNATTLSFYPCSTALLTGTNELSPWVSGVEHILMSAQVPNDILSAGEIFNYVREPWILLSGHIQHFCAQDTRFPKLKVVTFCGPEWETFVSDSRFEELVAALEKQSIQALQIPRIPTSLPFS